MEKLDFKKLKKDFGELKKDILARDIALLLIIPLAVTILMFFPLSLISILKLNIYNPSWWQILTFSFIHENFSHYIGNIIFFLIAVSLEFLLVCLMSRKKKYFQMYFYTFLSFPIISSSIILWLYPLLNIRIGTSSGMSGVVSAFIGFIPILVISYIERIRKIKIVNTNLLYLVLLFIFLFINSSYPSNKKVFWSIVIIFSIIVSLYNYRNNLIELKKGIKDSILGKPIFYYLLIFLIMTFIISLILIFPKVLRINGNITDIFIHYIGLIYGVVVSYIFLKKQNEFK